MEGKKKFKIIDGDVIDVMSWSKLRECGRSSFVEDEIQGGSPQIPWKGSEEDEKEFIIISFLLLYSLHFILDYYCILKINSMYSLKRHTFKIFTEYSTNDDNLNFYFEFFAFLTINILFKIINKVSIVNFAVKMNA